MNTVLGTVLEAVPRMSRKANKPEVNLTVMGDDGAIRYHSYSLADTAISTGSNKDKPIKVISKDILARAIGQDSFNFHPTSGDYGKLTDKRVIQTIGDEPYVAEDGAEHEQIERFRFLGGTADVDAEVFGNI